MKNLMLIMSTLLPIFGCGGFKSNAPTEILTTDVVAESKANNYSVKLSWPKQSDNSTLSIMRRDVKEKEAQLIGTASADDMTFQDAQALGGKSYEYTLVSQREGTLLLTKVLIPEDYSPTAKDDFSDAPKKINRLFLPKDYPISVRERTVIIEANEIIADQGVIQNFEEDDSVEVVGKTATEWRTPGATGGTIVLKAKKARGSLTIVARGAHGANGKRGAQGKSGSKGTRGNDGEIARRLGDGNSGYYCKNEPTDGGIGGVGGPGENGGDGKPGGTSGRVLVMIEDAADFNLKTESFGGHGGFPGIPGLPGLGGEGGDPGNPMTYCSPANKGPKGKFGMQGSEGNYGPDGKKEEACVQIAGKNFGDCVWALPYLLKQ